jgi:acyl carrier protein
MDPVSHKPLDHAMSPATSSAATAAAPNAQEDAIQAIIAELKHLLLRDLQIPIDEDKLDPHAPLLDNGLGLDSITLFELITLIEKRYQISFPVENLNSEVFANLAVVAQQVHSMINPNHAAGATS